MSVALRETRTSKRSITAVLSWTGLGVCVAILVGLFAYNRFVRTPDAEASAESQTEKNAQPDATKRSTVSFSQAKFDEARITTERVRFDFIATGAMVVGTVQLNADRQVEVRPRAAGVVREVQAVLGQNVKKGDTLVTLDSPEIGSARLNLRARQRELSTARFEAAWRSEIAANVALLIPELKRGIEQRRHALADDEAHSETNAHDPAKGLAALVTNSTDARLIEKQFADKQLGTYRGTLLQAYAEFDIASHEEQKTASLRSKNIVGEHPALVARHTREGIQAKLEAAIEQVRFDAAQEKRLAVQQTEQAEAAVIDAAQRLRILGVSENIQDLLDHAAEAHTLARDEDVTFYRIVAPFDGTIIKKDAVPSQRAEPSNVLFIVADLRSVWISASVSESDLAKLPNLRDGSFRVTAPAYPGRVFTGRLLSIGSLVDPQTRTLPILARAENPDGLLKPDMFVQIVFDSARGDRVLTVPARSVIEIETDKYVFIPFGKDKGKHKFTLRPVETGRKAGERVEVKAGLNEGDVVVSEGAFLLKSDLILQNEPDEE